MEETWRREGVRRPRPITRWIAATAAAAALVTANDLCFARQAIDPAPAVAPPESSATAAAAADGAAPASTPSEGAGTPVTVRLGGDEVLRGTLVELTANEVIVVHPILGRLAIPRRSIVSVEITVDERMQAVAAPAEHGFAPVPPDAAPATAAADPPSRIRGAPPKPAWATDEFSPLSSPEDLPPPGTVEWLANIQASLAGVNSDNDELDLRVAGGFARRTSDDLLTFDAEYYYSLVNGDTTDNNLLATLVYDRYFDPTDWLVFGKGQYQYDQFQSWEHRVSAYGGVGYRIFRLPPFALTVKLGAGGTHEFGDPQQTTPEGYAEAAFLWKITDQMRLEGGVNIAPDLTDLNSYRILARLDWILRLEPNGLSFVGGLREEYQSKLRGDGTNNDFRYYAGVRMDF